MRLSRNIFKVISIAGFLPVVFSGSSLIRAQNTERSETHTSKSPKQRPNPSSDNKNDKYRVVFDTSYLGNFDSLEFGKDDKKIQLASHSGLNSFINNLNDAGKQGYKIISSSSGSSIAVVSRDESEYEYQWFETTSPVHFATSGLKEKVREMSETGFRLIEHSQLFTFCEYADPENLAGGENCTYTDLFLFEKEKGRKQSVEQILINTFPGWGAKPSVQLTAEIEKKLAEGFYPVMAISNFEILLEKAKDKTDILDDKPEDQVIRSSWGNLKKKVSELAKQGYRLAVANHGIAVMYRNSETRGKPISYIWVRADKKKFGKELAKLQRTGVRYKGVFADQSGHKNTLIFESGLNENNKVAEFRVLAFGFDSREDKNEGKVYISLTPSGTDSVKRMNELAKQGFVVRDFFDGEDNKNFVLMERR